MTSELSMYLNEQLQSVTKVSKYFENDCGCIIKCETTKMKLAKNMTKRFLSKSVLYNATFFMLFKFLKTSYFLLYSLIT